jgi:hypothetical protein
VQELEFSLERGVKMPGQFQFAEYVFSTTALTESGVVTPLGFDIHETENGIVATARDCVSYGDPRRSYPGEITLTIERTAFNGLTWNAEASMAHMIKGVKVKIEPIPGTALKVRS